MPCGSAGASTDGSVLSYKFQDTFKTPAVGRFQAIRLVSESLDENRNKEQPSEINDSRLPSAPVSGDVSTSGDVNFEFSPTGYDHLVSQAMFDDERTGPFRKQVELDTVGSSSTTVGAIETLLLARDAGDWSADFDLADIVQVEGFGRPNSTGTFRVVDNGTGAPTDPSGGDTTILALQSNFADGADVYFPEAKGRRIRVTKVGVATDFVIEVQPTGYPDASYARITPTTTGVFVNSRVGDIMRLTDPLAGAGGLPSVRRQFHEVVLKESNDIVIVRSFARETDFPAFSTPYYEYTAKTVTAGLIDLSLPMRNGKTCRSLTWEREIDAATKLYDALIGNVPNTMNIDLGSTFINGTFGYVGSNMLSSENAADPVTGRQSTPDYYATNTQKVIGRGGKVILQRFGEPQPGVKQCITSLNFSVNNNVRAVVCPGDDEAGIEGPEGLRGGSFELGGGLAALVQGDALKDAFKKDATVPIEAVLNSTERHIYAIRVPEAGILTAPRPIPGRNQDYLVNSTFQAASPAVAGYGMAIFRFLQ